ncbi:hypothetical protein B0H15DRAFT_902421 [Mycena belliarum]|uniref:Uncharacterized protein n=1 Tax=Mycena belliarum TaxID=1033014 RepID=A0AAD6UDU2_9AGAR|nr:hypothetical protein B0H15DRAFT_902421 [Mycena belliae]
MIKQILLVATTLLLCLTVLKATFGMEGRSRLRYGSPVAMHFSATSHYQFNSAEADAEYRNLVPTGGHVVHVEGRPYTVALFHQMRCLDIIRQQCVGHTQDISPLTRHCLLYLRQTIICQSNPRLESVRNTVGSANRRYDAVCRDWTVVYGEAERNQHEYSPVSG